MLRNLEELLQSDFRERGIRFMLQCVPDPIETDGDPNQLSQVFLNLLKNAMQALEDRRTEESFSAYGGQTVCRSR